METTPQKVLFNYLRNIIFEDEAEPVELSELPEEWKELGEAIRLLQERLKNSRSEVSQLRELFQRIADDMSRYMIVFLSEEGEVLYQNRALMKARKRNSPLIRKLKERIQAEVKERGGILDKWETEIISQDPQSGLSLRWDFLVDVNAVRWDERPATIYMIEDITKQRHKEQEREGQALYDNLTGLHNRRYIMDVLESWVEENWQFCLTFVNLDNLKYANNAFGYSEGDRYIKQAAGLLAEIDGDKEIGRVSGDEFLLLVKNCRAKVLEHKLEEKRYHLLHRGMVQSADYRKSFSYGIIDSDHFESRNKSMMLREADALVHQYRINNKPKIKEKENE